MLVAHRNVRCLVTFLLSLQGHGARCTLSVESLKDNLKIPIGGLNATLRGLHKGHTLHHPSQRDICQNEGPEVHSCSPRHLRPRRGSGRHHPTRVRAGPLVPLVVAGLGRGLPRIHLVDRKRPLDPLKVLVEIYERVSSIPIHETSARGVTGP